MKRVLLHAVVAAALVSAGAAHAAPTQVNFGFVPTGNFTYVGASLGTSSALDFGNATFAVNTVGITAPFADDSGVFPGMAVFFSTPVFSYTIGSTISTDLEKSFTTGPDGAADSEGLYTVLFTSVTAGSSGDDFLNLTFQGNITGPGGFSAADVMLINCNQSGGTTLSVNCSFTEQAPPIPTQVPEPATLGLAGLALVGLAAVGRRRRPD